MGADNCAPRTIGRRRTIRRRHLGAEWQLGAEKQTIGRRSEILKNVIKNYNLKCEILMSFNFICDNINFRICNIFIFIFRQMAYIHFNFNIWIIVMLMLESLLLELKFSMHMKANIISQFVIITIFIYVPAMKQ